MTKAKRRLKNFNFEGEGSAVALVGKHQGSAANGYTTLLTKSTNKIPESFIKKASQVQVTMNIEDFLRKFFYLCYDEAEVLARMLGFETAMMDSENGEEEMRSYEDYIEEQIVSFQVMKSVAKADSIYKALSELNEDQFEQFLKDQQMIEKAMSSVGSEGVSNQNVEKTKEDVTKMSEENKDMIQKSEVESLIEKAVGELKTELQKAQDTIESYKAKEQEAVMAARKSALKEAVKNEEQAEVLFKSFEGVSDEAFKEAITALKSLSSAADEGEMFAEKGVDAEQKEPAAKETATAEFLKKKYTEK